jgi:CubicO group peptidase (beta-lactamase class C family)
MLIGIAQEKNLLNIDDKTSDYLGIGWTSLTQEREDSITIWHQMTMTSGLNPIDFTCVTPDCLTYLQSAGSLWAYHNGPYNLLKEVLENATSTPINQLTNNWIKTKIGMTSGFWLAAGDNTFFLSKARDMARFGLLVQNAGVWDTTIVLGDSTFMNNMLNTSQDLNPAYGYLWWLNGKSSFVAPGGFQEIQGMIAPNSPTDVVTAAGSNGQFVSISPSNGYVMIRQGLSSSNDNAAIALLDNIWKRIINLDCSTTSVKSINQMQIDVYPNPFSDFIQINGLDEQFLEVSLLNSKGQLLQYFSNQSKLKIIDLPSGLFYLKIKYKGEETYRKVIRK